MPPDDRTFDRLPEFHAESLQYPIRTLLAVTAKPPRAYTWKHVQLDQGKEGACTGFATTTEAAARPRPIFGDPNKNPDPVAINKVALEIYRRARFLDQWPGEDYEGSSVIAAMKAGQEKGWWKEYRWALGPGPAAAADDIVAALGYFGPVVVGTNWYQGMSTPTDGFLRPTGKLLGGHAFCLTAYSKIKNAVWTPNSWGGAGQGWITYADLVTLLDQDGEASIPVSRMTPV